MNPSTTHPAWHGVMLGLCILCAAGVLPANDELARQATWSIPSQSEVRSQLDSYLQKQDLEQATREKIDAMWANADEPRPSAEVLEDLADTFALADDEARELVEFCNAHAMPTVVPEFSVLESAEQPAFARHNLRLLFGQWLARHRYYDEALETLDELEPEDVVDPAALLFYRATGYHRMPDKNQCLPLVSKLLERQEQIPRRYATVAELIQADLKPLKADSLDEISRLMDEVKRRLELERAGKRVRDQEEQVVAKLDKLIKKLEEQQQQQQSGAAGGNISSSKPAQDSTPLGGLAPGKVDPKSIGRGAGWGNLPPKERQEALQQIGKDLPAHYREVIEQYFRKLAREEE